MSKARYCRACRRELLFFTFYIIIVVLLAVVDFLVVLPSGLSCSCSSILFVYFYLFTPFYFKSFLLLLVSAAYSRYFARPYWNK